MNYFIIFGLFYFMGCLMMLGFALSTYELHNKLSLFIFQIIGSWFSAGFLFGQMLVEKRNAEAIFKRQVALQAEREKHEKKKSGIILPAQPSGRVI
jgi:hypothetical protein